MRVQLLIENTLEDGAWGFSDLLDSLPEGANREQAIVNLLNEDMITALMGAQVSVEIED